MNAEEFAELVHALITQAEELGVSRDDVITELKGIVDGLEEDE